VVVAGGEPPPDTLAVFTNVDVAFDATFTVTVNGGKLAPLFSPSFRVHEVPEQFQPTPEREASVSPAGSVSVTVTGSAVVAPPPKLVTPIV
jgi:hypothetical protein